MEEVKLKGNPYWMAPEVLRGRPSTRESDAYSFAILLYEMIYRKDAYQDENPEVGLTCFVGMLRLMAWLRAGQSLGCAGALTCCLVEDTAQFSCCRQWWAWLWGV